MMGLGMEKKRKYDENKQKKTLFFEDIKLKEIKLKARENDFNDFSDCSKRGKRKRSLAQMWSNRDLKLN